MSSEKQEKLTSRQESLIPGEFRPTLLARARKSGGQLELELDFETCVLTIRKKERTTLGAKWSKESVAKATRQFPFSSCVNLALESKGALILTFGEDEVIYSKEVLFEDPPLKKEDKKSDPPPPNQRRQLFIDLLHVGIMFGKELCSMYNERTTAECQERHPLKQDSTVARLLNTDGTASQFAGYAQVELNKIIPWGPNQDAEYANKHYNTEHTRAVDLTAVAGRCKGYLKLLAGEQMEMCSFFASRVKNTHPVPEADPVQDTAVKNTTTEATKKKKTGYGARKSTIGLMAQTHEFSQSEERGKDDVERASTYESINLLTSPLGSMSVGPKPSEFEDKKVSRGALFLTNFRMVYMEYLWGDFHQNQPCVEIIGDAPYEHVRGCNGSMELPLGSVKQIGSKNGKVKVELKDFGSIVLGFDETQKWVDKTLVQISQNLAFPGDDTKTFAFKAAPQPLKPGAIDGWSIYDHKARELEYTRLGLTSHQHFRIAENRSANGEQKMYGLSPTYPAICIVPEKIQQSTLLEVCEYRSKKRLPATVWLHPVTDATISRCAQPMPGISNKQSSADVHMLTALRTANIQNKTELHIFDARPLKSAVGNRMMGKGFEKVEHYGNCYIHFMNIENIHHVRKSLEMLAEEAAVGGGAEWSKKVEDSKWLYHVKLIIHASLSIATMLEDQGASVVIHCSDGWDRTAQLSSLTQLLLDPYYRTIRGFIILIEKEWITFGYQFSLRSGHGCNNASKNDQRSPIFLQFLDCVWQVMRQYPLSFEFNENFLLTIHEHSTSCAYGTFLFDCELQRVEANVREKTRSLWTDMLDPISIEQFRNPFYVTCGPFDHVSQMPDETVPSSQMAPSTFPLSPGASFHFSSPSSKAFKEVENEELSCSSQAPKLEKSKVKRLEKTAPMYSQSGTAFDYASQTSSLHHGVADASPRRLFPSASNANIVVWEKLFFRSKWEFSPHRPIGTESQDYLNNAMRVVSAQLAWMKAVCNAKGVHISQTALDKAGGLFGPPQQKLPREERVDSRADVTPPRGPVSVGPGKIRIKLDRPLSGHRLQKPGHMLNLLGRAATSPPDNGRGSDDEYDSDSRPVSLNNISLSDGAKSPY